MRNLDFTPLYRASVGFDQIANLMDRVVSKDLGQSSYPPYNIEKTSDEGYRISIAVAGFSEQDLCVEQRESVLIISAKKEKDFDAEDGKVFLHRGIATRSFERRFDLADHVRVTGANHKDGMLHIDLIREVPEALKPRQIAIQSGTEIEGKAVEAKRSK